MTDQVPIDQLATDHRLLSHIVPLWHAERAWACELLKRSFNLNDAQEILQPAFRGRHQIPGTTWIYCTHGVGVDVYRTPEVGGIDFDFDKVEPDSWRLAIFLEKQANAGSLCYGMYQDLIEDEERLNAALARLFEITKSE